MGKDVSVIIVAAGESNRMGKGIRKPYILLKGKPVLRHSIDVFRNIPAVREIVIAINQKDLGRANEILLVPLKRDHQNDKKRINVKLVIGGKMRADSVFNALKATSDESKIVLVHDAARPFVRRADVGRLIKEVRQSGVAILAVPVKDTIKKTRIANCPSGINSLQITETITPRESLWAAQTPQGFRRDWLIKAYRYFRKSGNQGIRRLEHPMDDASLVEMLGLPVRIVRGSEENIKITTKADISHRLHRL